MYFVLVTPAFELYYSFYKFNISLQWKFVDQMRQQLYKNKANSDSKTSMLFRSPDIHAPVLVLL